MDIGPRTPLVAALLAALSVSVAQAAPPRPHPPPTPTSPSQKFAQTLNAVVQRPTSTAAGGVAPPSGRITKWFVPATPAGMASGLSRIKPTAPGPPGSSPPPSPQSPPSPQTPPGSQGSDDPIAVSSGMPFDASGNSGNAAPAVGTTSTGGATPAGGTTSAGAVPTAPLPDETAGPAIPVPNAAGPDANSTGIYAGMAYEIHALGRDGSATPVDPATYVFRSGDRFVVYYRPSMPGHIDVFNITPRGQQNAIDATNVAGGQLVTLGPYEFADNLGDESLRLVLTPCGSPALLASTRDITKVTGVPGAAGLTLPTCAATRGLRPRTRDIRKLQMDSGTSYALDAVSPREVASGQYDSRQVTITFHHQ
jgi:hypothetical protein